MTKSTSYTHIHNFHDFSFDIVLIAHRRHQLYCSSALRTSNKRLRIALDTEPDRNSLIQHFNISSSQSSRRRHEDRRSLRILPSGEIKSTRSVPNATTMAASSERRNENTKHGIENGNTVHDRELEDEHDYDAQGWGSIFREFRHSTWMMRPVTILMMVAVFAFFAVTLTFQLPSFLLGILMAPLLARHAWYIEFLYQLPIGRWGHFQLMSFSTRMRNKTKDKNRGFHSRTVEQKVEVVPGRVYIHFLPQWLDNVGYLVVCLPEPPVRIGRNSVEVGRENATPPIALVVDVGEMEAVVRAVELIQQFHYKDLPTIQIQSILSTHKHHDHTGGNAGFLKHPMGSHIRSVFGGAVEDVPCCTDFLADGETIRLPRAGSNDMNDLVEIEAISVPAHTRGSLVYRLRSRVGEQAEYLFTGDTMFSGGAGVPFESDVGIESDKQVRKSDGHTHVRGNLGTMALERCFAEIIARAKPDNPVPNVGERILIFPGHEYTQELLVRQFQNMVTEQTKWKNFSPRDFFETVSHMYVAFQRRSLPHNSGRLLVIPSTLERENHVNPHIRSLRRSADLVVRALCFWHQHFCTTSLPEERSPGHGARKAAGLGRGLSKMWKSSSSSSNKSSSTPELEPLPKKTPSEHKKWNLDANNVNSRVFTTVFTADLEELIEDLSAGKIRKKHALDQLRAMRENMEKPVVNKRSIPGFRPTDKNIYRGICGLVLLGAKPSAMTVSDSRRMKMPPPMDYNSDRIRISMKRLILVLKRLGLSRTASGDDVASIVLKLWMEANEYGVRFPPSSSSSSSPRKGYNSVDVESSPGGRWRDEIELGVLKWHMYGVSANQPSWFSKVFCMPCSSVPAALGEQMVPDRPHPASEHPQKSGDLVSHDILECKICRPATGCVNPGAAVSSSAVGAPSRLSLKETESDESGSVELGPGLLPDPVAGLGVAGDPNHTVFAA